MDETHQRQVDVVLARMRSDNAFRQSQDEASWRVQAWRLMKAAELSGFIQALRLYGRDETPAWNEAQMALSQANHALAELNKDRP